MDQEIMGKLDGKKRKTMINLLKSFNALENKRTAFISPITVFTTPLDPLRTSQTDLKCLFILT